MTSVRERVNIAQLVPPSEDLLLQQGPVPTLMVREPRDERLDRLAEVFERNHSRLFRYASHLVHRMGLHGVDSADDILAEVALVACQKAARSDAALPSDPNSLVAWLMRTALYVALNRYRRSKTERRAKIEYEGLLHDHELRNVLEDYPDRLSPEVRAVLATLDPTDRILLELSLRDGLTSVEIGQSLGMDPTAVRMRKARLLSRLHTRLTQ